MTTTKKIVIIILALVLVLVAVYFLRFKSEPLDQGGNLESERKNELEVLSKNLKELRSNDKDLDGLTDADEAKLGTNPQKVDTDQDGILDYDEINVYKSDPLKSDTDGDGFNDGHEVRRGYSPVGNGKL